METPTYISAVLVNFNDLSQAVLLGVPLIARVLETYRQELLEGRIKNGTTLLSFRLMGKAAKNHGPSHFLKLDLNGVLKMKSYWISLTYRRQLSRFDAFDFTSSA